MQGVYGAGAHTDYGALTVLATDDSPGLQINTGGHWQHVKPITGTLVINLGDMLERHVFFSHPAGFHCCVSIRFLLDLLTVCCKCGRLQGCGLVANSACCRQALWSFIFL